MSRTRPGDRESVRERIAYLTYATGKWLGAVLPEPVGRRLFRALGVLAHRALPGVRETVARNMGRVLGMPPDALLVRTATRDAFDLYARYWYETFRAGVLSPAELEARFEIRGRELLDEVLAEGRGVVAVTPHMGNWDATGAWLTRHGYRVVSVAERLKPERLSRLFLRHRAELGMRIIPLSDNGVGKRLGELLREGWIVGLVADRDLSGRGVEVEMFGAPRRLPAGPALLSLQSGAPLLVASVHTTDRGWRCVIGERLSIEPTGRTREDVAALTRAIAAAFERAIAANPADWHMFQPGWEGSEGLAAVRGSPP